jgi:hypothetical protein
MLLATTASADGVTFSCINIGFPFELLLADSTTVEVNSLDDYENVSSDVDVNPWVDFVYPLDNVTDADGNVHLINSGEEFYDLWLTCETYSYDNDTTHIIRVFISQCHQLVYPIDLLTDDNTIVTVDNYAEYDSLAAYSSNAYKYIFPVQLVDEQGNPMTADNFSELYSLVTSCSLPVPGLGDPDGVAIIKCLIVDYPLHLWLRDGSAISVNNYEEYKAIALQGAEGGIDFRYPLLLINADGNNFSVNNVNELYQLADAECP